MQALPTIKNYLKENGLNMTNYMTNNPICCPSRSTILTGRYSHNNRIEKFNGHFLEGCMYMNTSLNTNPSFWNEHSFARGLKKQNYITSLFGKSLNVGGMNTICDFDNKRDYIKPPYFDKWFSHCTFGYYNVTFNNDGKKFQTGISSNDYTTSVVGNQTVNWLTSIFENNDINNPVVISYIISHLHQPIGI